MFPPRRIICLTEETTETLYLLGEQDRIVGISGYTVRPRRARREKPRVASFLTVDTSRILALEPDLVLAFSDLQAEAAASLTREGLAVHIFNQRTVSGIFDMIETLGALVGAGDRAKQLVVDLRANLEAVRRRTASRGRRPRIYFEEWDDPMICGIGWVSELIAIAGGEDIFADRARGGKATDRIVQLEHVLAGAPEIIIGSWCGRKFRPEKLTARPGFHDLPAVRAKHLHEIKSSIILQPGPAALTDGLAALEAIVSAPFG